MNKYDLINKPVIQGSFINKKFDKMIYNRFR